ncbi:MAG TPA: DoxX family protein [Gemmatimonadaceae bacterium]|nr:DoxX family protein [Gemmatimonadaceae bacterium]
MSARRNHFLIAALFIVAGVVHFLVPDRYAGIMPGWVPFPREMVYVSGVLEIAGGVGVLIPGVRRLTGICLIALLIAVFPANLQMLANAINGDASTLYKTALFLRLPLQPLMIVWIYRATLRPDRLSQSPRTNL